MSSAGFKQQTRALIQKSWTYQKRNMGTNVALCIAPIFFCLILAISQALVNVLLTASDDLKCGCQCTSCCPAWALTSKPGNYTYDGKSNITAVSAATLGSVALSSFAPSAVTLNADGTLNIQVCSPKLSGSCTQTGFSCQATDKDTCGLQYSTAAQSVFCAIPYASTWPAVFQAPEPKARAKPWGAWSGLNNITEQQAPVLVTANTARATAQLLPGIFPGQISTQLQPWLTALSNLYTGNKTIGNVFNGDQLAGLGLQFGTKVTPGSDLYLEGAFQTGNDLYALVPNNTCSALGLKSNSPICISDFLRLYINATDPTSSLLQYLSPCTTGAGAPASGQLLSAISLNVNCTETALVPVPDASALNRGLYCGYRQAYCNGTSGINQQYLGAIDFANTSAAGLAAALYYNGTIAYQAQYTPVYRLPALLNAAATAWWQNLTGTPASQSPMQLLCVMSMPKVSSSFTVDLSSLLGPLFYSWVIQLLMPTFLQQLVYEKEKRLRMMMKMHGLGDATYWLVTYLWYLVMYIVYIAILIVIGPIVRLKIFTKTNYGVLIIFLFLHGNTMIAFCFLLSCFFLSSRTAVVAAFLYVFASGLIGQLLLAGFMESNKQWCFFVEWVPAFSLFRGLLEIADYAILAGEASTTGLTFSKLKDVGNGMVTTWAIFLVEWAIFLPLGWYLEQVLGTGIGIRRRPLFFLDVFKSKANSSSPATLEAERTSAAVHAMDMGKMKVGTVMMDLADVAAEEARVDALVNYDETPIVVKDIKKVYPGLDGGKPKMAVRTMTLGIQRGECFGLLGPNGAGKTTTIGMLTGFLEPSGGTGIVEGFDIMKDMQEVYKLMGVCPQHDLLWEQLSGREHLQFYGKLKGLAGPGLDAAIDVALKGVNLFNGGVGNKQCGKYSGGMKRRLSVAISLIGSPKVVFMDEPSTGLDPASRRNLWDVVKASKDGRAIILTTHSMEEAEMLCDRLGIFVDGQLVCLGNPREITSRYAGFLVFSLTVPLEQAGEAKQAVQAMSPSAVLTYELGGTFKFELPTSEVSLSKVFQAMNTIKQRIRVVDWGVANATLEEVFIKLAKGMNAVSKD